LRHRATASCFDASSSTIAPDLSPAPKACLNCLVRELPTGLAEADKFLDELVLATSKVE
jgi:hypothetical protein